MRYVKLGIILCLTFSILSGCSFFTSSNIVKEREVQDYNSLVETTIDNYAKSSIFATEHKEDLLNYVLMDKKWSLIEDKSIELPDLTEEEVKAFELYDVLYDEYFTAIGASGVREVLIIKGWGYEMYVTIVWGLEEVVSISRMVVKS